MKYFFAIITFIASIALLMTIDNGYSIEILGWISAVTGWGTATILKFREDSE